MISAELESSSPSTKSVVITWIFPSSSSEIYSPRLSNPGHEAFSYLNNLLISVDSSINSGRLKIGSSQ